MTRATPAERKIARINARMHKLRQELDQATRERGAELGFEPCGDCWDGFCSMNFSSAPTIMKVL